LATIVAGNVKFDGTIMLLESGAMVEGNINSDIGIVYVGNSTVGGNLNVVG
jgi:cytoskeletal protein CcmA (bactofilin family)